MRIRVTTSINVRSNTVPSTSARDNEDFPPLPQPQGDRLSVEKARSKSPLPFLLPHSDMSKSRLMDSQRPPKGSRLSAWLHGFSSVREDHSRTATHNRKISHTSTYCYARTPRRRSRERTTGRRPVDCARRADSSMQHPVNNAQRNPTFDNHGEEWSRGGHQRPSSTFDAFRGRRTTNVDHLVPHHDQHKPVNFIQKKKPIKCFPHIEEPKIRHKILGCLFFGTLLAIVLTTCMSIILTKIYLVTNQNQSNSSQILH